MIRWLTSLWRQYVVICDDVSSLEFLIQPQMVRVRGLWRARRVAHRWTRDHDIGQASICEGPDVVDSSDPRCIEIWIGDGMI
jgi:hypothetical protein